MCKYIIYLHKWFTGNRRLADILQFYDQQRSDADVYQYRRADLCEYSDKSGKLLIAEYYILQNQS